MNGSQPVKSIFKTKGLEVNSYANLPSLNPLSDAGILIHQILEVIQHRPIEPKQQKGLNYSYFQDRTFIGQVKSIGLNSKHCFLKVKDDTTDFETLLHVKGCHGARVFDHMSTYLYPTDSIRFKVDEIQGDKLVVSIHDALKQHAEIVLKQPIETTCVLVKRYDSRLFFISEEGYPIVLMTEEACQYKIGSFFKIQLNDFNQ